MELLKPHNWIRCVRRNGLSLSAIALILLIGIGFSGCGEAPPEEGAEGEHAEEAAEAEMAHASVAEDDDDGGNAYPEEVGKVFDFLPMSRLPYEEFEIPVMDSQHIYARLYDPSQKGDEEDESEDGAEKKYPLVILLHSLNGSHRDWGQLPARLVDAGYAVLTPDMRGHGKSTRFGPSWRLFKSRDWGRLPDDTVSMMKFFKNNEDYPQVDVTRTAVIGASVGANAALEAGAQDNATDSFIKAIVCLSAGLDYKSLEATKPIYRYKNSLLMIASQNDTYAYDSTKMLHRLHTGPQSVLFFKDIGHGTDMVQFFPKLQDKVLEWLTKNNPPTAAEIVDPYDEEESDGEDMEEVSHDESEDEGHDTDSVSHAPEEGHQGEGHADSEQVAHTDSHADEAHH